MGLALSTDVDEGDLDGVVAVAQAVPRRHVGLDVAGGVGGSSAQRVSADAGRVPLEGPVLPLGGIVGGSTVAGCQSPSPVRLMSTRVIGPDPDHAFPRMVYVPASMVDPGAGSVMRARTRMRLTGSGARSGHWYM